ncbi:hypothetical protein P7K49_015656, partial [Saguinus oedipus]
MELPPAAGPQGCPPHPESVAPSAAAKSPGSRRTAASVPETVAAIQGHPPPHDC